MQPMQEEKTKLPGKSNPLKALRKRLEGNRNKNKKKKESIQTDGS